MNTDTPETESEIAQVPAADTANSPDINSDQPITQEPKISLLKTPKLLIMAGTFAVILILAAAAYAMQKSSPTKTSLHPTEESATSSAQQTDSITSTALITTIPTTVILTPTKVTTAKPTNTPTQTPSTSSNNTPIVQPTNTQAPTNTPAPTATQTPTPTNTPNPSATPTTMPSTPTTSENSYLKVIATCANPGINVTIQDKTYVSTQPYGVWTYLIHNGQQIYLAYTGPSGSNASASIYTTATSIRGGNSVTLAANTSYTTGIAPSTTSSNDTPSLGSPFSEINFTTPSCQ